MLTPRCELKSPEKSNLSPGLIPFFAQKPPFTSSTYCELPSTPSSLSEYGSALATIPVTRLSRRRKSCRAESVCCASRNSAAPNRGRRRSSPRCRRDACETSGRPRAAARCSPLRPRLWRAACRRRRLSRRTDRARIRATRAGRRRMRMGRFGCAGGDEICSHASPQSSASMSRGKSGRGRFGRDLLELASRGLRQEPHDHRRDYPEDGQVADRARVRAGEIVQHALEEQTRVRRRSCRRPRARCPPSSDTRSETTPRCRH